ncbi:hypothetical protein B0I35DRAFT_512732, partial [Stachybotrys elegans]
MNGQPLEANPAENSLRRLACPFQKFHSLKCEEDPGSLYSTANSRSCIGPGFKTVQRLKEHLKRIHSPVQCERCLKIFPDGDPMTRLGKLYEHRQQDVACPKRDGLLEKGISEAQWLRIKQRYKRSQECHGVDAWFKIWAVIFPATKPPVSP